MAEVKWIKITTDMFDNRKIKHIRKLPEGNNIVLIWVMLLTMAGKCNAGGFIFLTEDIPYTTKMLADELDFDESVIKVAITALERFGMISTENDMYMINGWEEHQNKDGLEKIREQARVRQAKYRDKQKQIGSNAERNVTVTSHNALDIDKDIDKEKDNKDLVRNSEALFERLWKLYPNKKGKGQVSNAQKKRLYAIGEPTLVKAIERYSLELQKDADWRKPQNGSTFFNSGYKDYLDENYVPSPEPKKPAAKNKFNNFKDRDYSHDELLDLERQLLQ